MRYPTEHKQATRERIVRAAARRFRSQGSEGAAISDLMRDLKLTHGGFYRHFESKEDLFAESFAKALEELRDKVAARVEKALPGRELQTLIETYLAPQHCKNVAGGCPVAALASQLSRRPSTARAPFLRALGAHVHRMAKYVPGASPAERERKAGILFSGMAGTLAIARTLANEKDRDALLESARTFYLNATRG